MKILHLPYGYFPDPSGGTEAYVAALVRALRELGVDSVVAAPGEASRTYEYGGTRVQRFAVSAQGEDLRELYGEGAPGAAREFAGILDEERPDVVHFHAFTRGASLLAVREAKRRGMPVVFTYHTPTVSCPRGTLLRWGSEPCDGVLRVGRCAKCTLHGRGAGRVTSAVLGGIPACIGRLAGAIGLSGGVWTALRMTELLRLRQGAFRALVAEVDRIVAPCRWVQELLERNTVPSSKITLSRQGTAATVPRGSARDFETDGELRLAFLGRLDPTKGPDLVVKAIRSVPRLRIHFDLYGIDQGGGADGYGRRLRDLAADDPRIEFREPVSRDEVFATLVDYHLVAVPSQWFETGPLVVLESFAAGVPVVGTALGGIQELVSNEVDGLLVPPRSVEGWRGTLARFHDEPTLHRRLRAGIRSPRKMSDVAADMKVIYSTFTSSR